MDAALNVKFGADTTALISGLKTVEGEVNKAKLSLGDLQRLLKQLEAERPQIVDDKQLKQYNQTIAALKTNIKDLTNVGVQGFDEFGKKIDTSSGSITKATSGLRQLANILPGIGIAGIFNLAFEAISKLVGETEKLDSVLSKIKSEKGIIAEAVGGTAGDIARVEALARAVQNTNLTYGEREKALNSLKEINKSYFGDLTLEESKLKLLTTRVQEYSNALIQEAIVKGFTEEIAKQSIELAREAGELDKLKDKLDRARAAQAAFKDVPIVAGGRGGGTGTSDAALQQNKLAAAVNLATDNFIKQRDKVDVLSFAIAGYKDRIQGAVDNLLKLRELKIDKGGGVIDTLSKTDAALREIIKLEDELAKPNELPLFQRLANSLDSSRAELIETKIAEVIRNNARDGISKAITEKEVALLREQLRRLLNPDLREKIDIIIDVDPHVRLVADAFAVVGKIGPQLDAVLKKLPPLKTDIKVDPNLVLDKTEFAKANERIKNVIGEAGVDLAVGLAEDIGKAFAGVKNPFGNIAQILGDGLEALGKQLIIVGGLSQLIQKLLPTIFTPAGAATAILVGVLAIAAGAALKSINATKGVKAFAEGGIVTGPTNALIGEAGPEVVFPLDKLNKFIRGNTGTSRMEIVGNTVISGPNLITVFKRAQNNQGMV